MSPVLPDAKMLSGQWAVAEEGSTQSCPVTFTMRPVGNGHAVETDVRCLPGLRLNGAVAWRAAPDGIALASESGRTIAFFSREGANYALRRADRPSLLLIRGRWRGSRFAFVQSVGKMTMQELHALGGRQGLAQWIEDASTCKAPARFLCR
jgi:hypothetical protein